MGNGETTSFWKVAWRGEEPFMVKFHRLFSISNNKEASIQEMWTPNASEGRWNFSWRCQLFVWENNLLIELLGMLDGFERCGVDDRWRWKLEDDHIFSVKSMYLKLESRKLWEDIRPEGEMKVFRQIWKFGAPFKVSAFVWKAFLNRIPTCLNLEVRNCLPPDIGNNCVWCVSVPKSSTHLFLHCDLAWKVWSKVMLWLDLNFVMPPNLFIHW